MNRANLLINQVLEAAGEGDQGVHLISDAKVEMEDKSVEHHFRIMHPKHGMIGRLIGTHHPDKNEFAVDYVHLGYMPNYKSQKDRGTPGYGSYEGAGRTLVRAGLRSLIHHIPNLEKITSDNRLTGVHKINSIDGNTGTSIRIPKKMKT